MIRAFVVRYDDNVTELCAEENLEKPYNGPRQACFWEDIEPLPPSLKHMEEQVCIVGIHICWELSAKWEFSKKLSTKLELLGV